MSGSSIQLPRLSGLSVEDSKNLERSFQSVDTAIKAAVQQSAQGGVSQQAITALQTSLTLLQQTLKALQIQVNQLSASGGSGATQRTFGFFSG